MQNSKKIRKLKLAIFAHQISNYHVARFKAAKTIFEQLTVFSVANSADFQEFFAHGYETDLDVIHLCSDSSDYALSVRTGNLSKRIHSELNRLQPDIVVVAGWAFSESLIAIAWAHGAKSKVIMMSESQRHDGERSLIRELFKRRVIKYCDSGLVGGETHREYLELLGMNKDKIFTGYDVIDHYFFSTGADRARQNPDDFRKRHNLPRRFFLASSRFIRKKNLLGLIEAYALSTTEHSIKQDLVIIGDGPQKPEIQEKIRSFGLEARVRLPGFQGYPNLPGFFGLSEGFLHLSTTEQWGLVINEAASCGIPIIASENCGATPELIHHGRNGWIVAPFDTRKISARINELAGLSQEERFKMGRLSRDIGATFAPEAFAQGLELAAEAAIVGQKTVAQVSMLDKFMFETLSRRQISKVY